MKKKVSINKPIHQEDKNQSKFSKTIEELDMGKLGLGVACLITTGGFLYPQLLSSINISMLSTSLVSVGIGTIGALAGALAVDITLSKTKEIKEVTETEFENINLTQELKEEEE